MTPIGSMIYYPSLDIPNGYLVCDGSEKLIADYPLLFNAIGYIGGEDVDTGYFRLPDMRGVVPGGFNPHLVGTTNPLAGNFGDQVGNPTKSLSVANLAKHKHDIVYSDPNADITQKGVSISHDASGSLQTLSVESFVWANQTANKFGGGSNNIFAAYEGSGSPFSIVQPTKLYHWLIKAKNIITLGGYTEDFEIRGNLKFLSNRFFSGKGQYAIDLNNSDIIGANAIYFNDSTDSGDEGFNFLKSGASPKSDNPDDYDNLKVLDNSLLLNNVKVVESGSNSNGRWTKWHDGTMICYKNINFGDVAITTAWGSFYETASDYSCGNYPQAFIETPCISIMPLNTCFVEKKGNTTATSWGSFWACRPAKYESFSLVVACIAIGKWK